MDAIDVPQPTEPVKPQWIGSTNRPPFSPYNAPGHKEDLLSITLEDFNYRGIRIQSIAKRATQTCRGSPILQPIVHPIAYTGATHGLKRATAEEFRLKKEDEDLMNGTRYHHFDHVNQNKQVAARIR